MSEIRLPVRIEKDYNYIDEYYVETVDVIVDAAGNYPTTKQIVAALNTMAVHESDLHAERDALAAQVERMRGLVEAARSWVYNTRDDLVGPLTDTLVSAVLALEGGEAADTDARRANHV